MKQKKAFLFISTFALAIAGFGAVVLNRAEFKDLLETRADLTYTLNVDGTSFAGSGLTTTYQQNVVHDFGENRPVLNYFLAKLDNDNHLVLAPAGRLFNYKQSATYKGRITNMISLTINYSGGALYVQEGIGGSETQYGAKVAITSGDPVEFDSHPNFIMVSNSVAETTITSISISYSCSEAGYTVDRLGEKYNGKAADGTVYTIVRSGNNVSFNDDAMTGTIAVDGSGNFTMTLESGTIVYSGKVSSDYHTLTFTDKSGSGAESAPTITAMNRIYVMDDFESYSQRGTGYTAEQTSAFTASDLRAAYYVDAGSGSGATWVSGSGFKIPSTANYLNISTSGTGPVHSGKQAMLLQGQKAGWVRAWNNEVFNQNQHYNFGRGNKLSFWVHSGRNNANGTGVNASNVTIRAQVYYQNFVLTDSTRNSTIYGTGTKDFTINTDTGWNECIINLDSTKTVYAINIMINNSGISTDYVFMPIDDITIYTEPVYEPTKKYNETATQFTKSYHGSVVMSVMGQSATFTVKVALGANGYVYAYAGANMEPTDYVIDGSQITIHTTGSYSGKEFGDWVGTLSNNNNTITINKGDITGDITDYMSSSSITLTADTAFITGSENIATLRSYVTRQTGSEWTDYAGEDKFTFTDDYYMEGSNALRVKPQSDVRQRLIVNPTVAESMGASFDSVAFWFYAPAGVSYYISIYTYKDYTPSKTSGRYAQQWEATYDGSAEQAGWHYINMGLNSANGYGKNFSIYIDANASPTIIDYVTYF